MRLRRMHSLILDPVLLAVRPDGVVPPVAFVPPVLHDVYTTPAVALESLKHSNVVRVAHADFAHDTRVLEPDERAPRGEGLRERPERRVQEEAVEVRGVQVRKRFLDGGLDLCLDVCLRVVRERLGLILTADWGIPGMNRSEQFWSIISVHRGARSLCLDEQVFALDTMLALELLQRSSDQVLSLARVQRQRSRRVHAAPYR